MNELDNAFQSGVNEQMCTQFCLCPGDATKQHYKQYRDEVTTEEYQIYNRTFFPKYDFEKMKQEEPQKYQQEKLHDKSLNWVSIESDPTAVTTETMV